MKPRPCKPLGWAIRHTKTKFWYKGSSGFGRKRGQDWSACPVDAKQYAAACHANAAAQMINMVPGNKTDTYLLVESHKGIHAIKFSRETAQLESHNFALTIREPHKSLTNSVNR